MAGQVLHRFKAWQTPSTSQRVRVFFAPVFPACVDEIFFIISVRGWWVDVQPARVPQVAQSLAHGVTVVDKDAVGVVAVLTLHRQVEHMTHGEGVLYCFYRGETLTLLSDRLIHKIACARTWLAFQRHTKRIAE